MVLDSSLLYYTQNKLESCSSMKTWSRITSTVWCVEFSCVTVTKSLKEAVTGQLPRGSS